MTDCFVFPDKLPKKIHYVSLHENKKLNAVPIENWHYLPLGISKVTFLVFFNDAKSRNILIIFNNNGFVGTQKIMNIFVRNATYLITPTTFYPYYFPFALMYASFCRSLYSLCHNKSYSPSFMPSSLLQTHLQYFILLSGACTIKLYETVKYESVTTAKKSVIKKDS